MRYFKNIVLAIAALLVIAGCDICCTCGEGKDRIEEYESVMILYSDGYNDLMSYLKEDIFDLTKGWVPDKKSDKAIVVISSLAAARGNYSTPTKPSMLQIYKNKGQVQVDTLRYYSETMKLSDPDDMKIILNDLDELFKAKHYGAVMSSHASGWVPEGYYRNPDAFESGNTYMMRRASADFERERLEYPDDPAVKSFGGTYRKDESGIVAYEIDLPELAHQCFPFHLDYLIFDACLMGGVEVAYELKDLADYVVFSQAEILADGLDYIKLSSRLLEGDSPDVVAVADDFFEQYQNKTDLYRSATISAVDCRKLDALSTLCSELFSKYREGLDNINASRVQGYFRYNHHWYYDLKDILAKAGADEAELKAIDAALGECIIYKNATESFMGTSSGFEIKVFSGLSMYLPANGSAYLDNFYKTLAWNKATKLVD